MSANFEKAEECHITCQGYRPLQCCGEFCERLASQQAKAAPPVLDGEQRRAYVVTVDFCAQVGADQWQMFREAKPLNGAETIGEIMDWANRVARVSQVTIVVVTP